MEQLTQQLGSGVMSIQELPTPLLDKGMVLVKNHYSLISTGTEGNAVRGARKNIIGKIKDRPKQVQQVFETLKKQGIVQTYRSVMKKLNEYSKLGYSCAGEVIDVSEDVTEFKVGDLVACGGASATHSEIVAVPINLCVKLEDDANLSEACYNTLGSIALQGIRQADLRLGESCAVIGLGLLGNLTALMLRASGVKVIGIDVKEKAVKLAAQHCCDRAYTRDAVGIENHIEDFTNGYGVDAVIITASASSLDPINFAGSIVRKKGIVVVVGAVPTGYDRGRYYEKELTLKMSCSYGPGRYDFNYEEKGIDYPYAYVRWTEKRNMEAFQELLYSKSIDISYLTTHIFDFKDALKPYDMIASNSEPYLGLVLKYDINKKHINHNIIISSIEKVGKVNLAFIGAGNYAQAMLLPNFPTDGSVVKKAVLTNTGTSSKRVAERFNFEYCTSDVKEILNSQDINTIFIATRHDLHAKYVLAGIYHNKNVYVEKPLCLTIDELLEIQEACSNNNKSVMVGFNRRFSPSALAIKQRIGKGKMAMLYRVNAGYVPSTSWVQDMNVGGGRIIGEVCHFIDLMTFMCDGIPVKIYTSHIENTQNLNDVVNINIEFDNGSIGTVSYYANGSKSLEKEYFEVHTSGVSGIIHDFKYCTIYEKGKPVKIKSRHQDKGQSRMLSDYCEALLKGESLIQMEQIIAVTKATFAALKSIQEGGLPVIIK